MTYRAPFSMCDRGWFGEVKDNQRTIESSSLNFREQQTKQLEVSFEFRGEEDWVKGSNNLMKCEIRSMMTDTTFGKFAKRDVMCFLPAMLALFLKSAFVHERSEFLNIYYLLSTKKSRLGCQRPKLHLKLAIQ